MPQPRSWSRQGGAAYPYGYTLPPYQPYAFKGIRSKVDVAVTEIVSPASDTNAFTVTIDDRVGLGDSLTVLTTRGAGTDTVGLTDDVTPVLTTGGGTAHTVTVDDTVGLADTRTFDIGLVINDTTGLTDTRAFTGQIVITDQVGLVDTRAFTRELVINDLVGLTDAQVVSRTVEVTVNDSAGLTDALVMARGLVVNDTVGLVDTRTFTRDLAITETTGLTDTLAFTRSVVINDSVGLTDAQAAARALAFTVDDTVGLTDTQGVVFTGVSAWTVTLTDTVLAQGGFYVDLYGDTYPLGGSDTLTFTRTMVINDSVGLTDTRTVTPLVPQAYTVTITDLLALTDTATPVLTVPPTAVYVFRTPTIGGSALARGALDRERSLMRHYHGYPGRGVAVIIWPDLTITERRVLRGDEHLTARNIFMGGHENVVDPTTAAILDAAGYDLVEV